MHHLNPPITDVFLFGGGGGRVITQLGCVKQVDACVYLLPPATKLGQGNIFRSMCQEFCPQGGKHGRGACVARVVCVSWGACMAGGVHGRGACMAGGHAWKGACMVGGVHGRGGLHGRYYELTVNERAVRILLECILVIDL